MPLDFICVECDNAYQMFVRSFRIELETSRESYSCFYGVCHVFAVAGVPIPTLGVALSHMICTSQPLVHLHSHGFSPGPGVHPSPPHDDDSSGGNIVVLTE